MTVQRIPEAVIAGRRLGRHLEHDPRSLAYRTGPAAPVSVGWPRHIPILDQGQLGSCTGNATVGALGSGPLWDALQTLSAPYPTLDEALAVSIYSDAERVDGGVGYPPEDNGSTGLSVAKVAQARGLISGYRHATSVAEAHGALQAGPFIIGTEWLTGMDNPGPDGVVAVTGTVRGGHEYVCRQYDADRDLWWFDNSWGVGFGVGGRFAYDTPGLEKLLGRQGDVTSFVPVTAPAPTPGPVPGMLTREFTAEQAAALEAWADKPHIWHLATVAAKAWKASRPR